jgi:hypothetical protein
MHSILRCGLIAASALAVVSAQADSPSSELNPNHVGHRANWDSPTNGAPTAGATGQQTPVIKWNGGPVMTGAPNVHLIWYGNWAQANGSDNAGGQQIVRDMFAGIGGTPYLQINTGFTGSNGAVSGLLGSQAESTVGYTSGTRLRDADIKTIVTNYINSTGRKDTNAVYFVLTSSDVTATSGFCTKYCGWHTSATISGANIKYSFVGNANRCLSGCAAQTTGPNGNAGVDGMVSVIAHELEETLSDPNPSTGWTDSNGAENADKCAWTFGANLKTAANGASYNQTFTAQGGGTRNFLIQRNLDALSKCYTNYVTKAQ